MVTEVELFERMLQHLGNYAVLLEVRHIQCEGLDNFDAIKSARMQESVVTVGAALEERLEKLKKQQQVPDFGKQGEQT